MKITKSYLQQVIKEELQKINEQQEIQQEILGNLFGNKEVKNMMTSAKHMLEKRNLQGVCSVLASSPEFKEYGGTLRQIPDFIKSISNYKDILEKAKFGQKCFDFAHTSGFKLLRSNQMRNFRNNEKGGSEMGNLLEEAIRLIEVCFKLSPSAASK
jgi:hypothetical protein